MVRARYKLKRSDLNFELILPDFTTIKENLSVERKTLMMSEFSQETPMFRENDEAISILTFYHEISEQLFRLFDDYPEFLSFFDKEFMDLKVFWSRNYIVETLFLAETLFDGENHLFPLVDEQGKLKTSFLDDYRIFFKDWIDTKRANHEKTQTTISAYLKLDVELKDLDCNCTSCLADYRTKSRELGFSECVNLIEECREDLRDNLNEGMNYCSSVFKDLKKSLELKIRGLRFKLKRSSIHKLESQVKNRLEQELHYPSDIALEYASQLESYLKSLLKAQNIRSDLVGKVELERFFRQLGSNIWGPQGYLEREFKKLIKSVLFLKRQDISSNILKEYLGQFWLHTEARRIHRKIIYHCGPTNSGKTYQAIESLSRSQKGCYLAPLRLLAAELYDTLNTKGVVTTLLTGEEVIEVKGATHYSSTIEMARLDEHFDCCIIDEIQMLTDPQRGWAWTRALVNIMSDEIHLCGDDSVMDLVQDIVKLTGDSLEVKYYERMTELLVQDSPIKLGDLDRGDALIVFSRKNALKYKRDLEQMDFKVSIVYGRLSPEVRREQARKFDKGETDVIVSTDAISMGMNLPIKRIVFSTLAKFINSKEYPISDSEIKQISGRAGRFGRFPTGYVNCLSRVEDGLNQIQHALNLTLPQKDVAMVGPDLDIFRRVNLALSHNGLPSLGLTEFLRLFNTMNFSRPFYCVDLKEMIELSEMVEDADPKGNLLDSEVFGFACSPVNLGLIEHVQYFVWILNHYVAGRPIRAEDIDWTSNDIDYLETSIKCVELYQWLSRHFKNKNFDYDEYQLLDNKSKSVDQLNELLSQKIVKTCSSCGVKIDDDYKFNICDTCFKDKKFNRRPRMTGTYAQNRPGSSGVNKKHHHNANRSASGGVSKNGSRNPDKKKSSYRSAKSKNHSRFKKK